jgi:hypothetical protein
MVIMLLISILVIADIQGWLKSKFEVNVAKKIE